ncbi:hypothetical protein BS47DRAFT_1342778 [Hydnum rufescens UP504]|uniref:Uncharacterized protein n=1 Tax=Hydnum rufescens UP504 TaxID=1448309 RepID=A0A9P6DV03_9AGAM|nr:hypothetical protein BS47DRAFT_1342778 [Hydnum rufescens UP504]
MNGALVNIFGGSFIGNLLTALSVSSSLKDGHGRAGLMYLAGALASSLSRPLAIIIRSQMMEGR